MNAWDLFAAEEVDVYLDTHCNIKGDGIGDNDRPLLRYTHDSEQSSTAAANSDGGVISK